MEPAQSWIIINNTIFVLEMCGGHQKKYRNTSIHFENNVSGAKQKHTAKNVVNRMFDLVLIAHAWARYYELEKNLPEKKNSNSALIMDARTLFIRYLAIVAQPCLRVYSCTHADSLLSFSLESVTRDRL